jgi:microcystin degradation protein MlrC
MRIAIGEFKQETNTFATRSTTLEDFRAWHLWTGEEVIHRSRNTNCEVAGFLDVLEQRGVEIVPTVATFAMSGGRVVASAYRELCDLLLNRLAQAGELDGVLLALHGAMVTDDDDDPDGATIAAVRSLIGPTVPLVVTMDLHANVTRRCVEHADAIVGFRTSPHVDLRETGQRAAHLLLQAAMGEVRPVMAFAKIPMVVPASMHMHDVPGPFQRLMNETVAAEGGRVLAASMFAVQPWLDIREMGFATVVVADANATLAQQVACELADRAWSEREAFLSTELVSIDVAIQRALARPDGPVVLSDVADGTGAGSPGDATAVIAALLEANPRRPAYVCVRDPEIAQLATEAGVGADLDVLVGGKLDRVFNRPVRFSGTVIWTGHGRFRFSGQGYTGVEMDMGPSAVLRHGQISLLVMSNAVMTVDPAMYRAVGLEPTDAQIVVVKSHIQFRAGYEGIARVIILLDSPGMSSDHLETLPFSRVNRPLFPLDRAAAYRCEAECNVRN